MRLYPIVQRLKKLVQNRKVIAAHGYVGQYLPDWRSSDYRQCYSATKWQAAGFYPTSAMNLIIVSGFLAIASAWPRSEAISATSRSIARIYVHFFFKRRSARL